MNDDTELLRRYVREHSEQAFTELVQRRIGLVYSIAYRHTRDAHRAQDVAQVVFAAIARNAAKLARQPILVGWFYRATHNAAIDLLRADRSRAVREQEAQTMQTILESSGQEPDWEQVAPVLDEVINELDDTDRDAVLLRFFDAISFAEIGARLRLSENAARMRVDRALDKLHARLSRRGVTSTTAALGAALAGQAALAVPATLATTISTTVLAGSAVATGTSAPAVAGLLMNKATWIASAAAALAIGSAVYEFNAAAYAEAIAANYRRENDALRTRLLAAQRGPAGEPTAVAVIAPAVRTLAAVERPENSASPTVESASSANATKAAPKNAPDDSTRKSSVRADRAGKSITPIPEGRLDNWYVALYQQLRLSPAQISQFKTMALENVKRHEELDRIAATQGLKVTDPEMEDFYVQADAELQSKLVAAFGDDAVRQIRLFSDQLPLRDVTAQMNNMLVYTSNPLSMPQVEALIAMMWDNMRDASGKISTKAANTAAMRKHGKEILQPDQYHVIGQWMDILDKENGAVAQNGAAK